MPPSRSHRRGRYTPPAAKPRVRHRPAWHKAVGGLAAALAAGLFFAGRFGPWEVDGGAALVMDAVALVVGGSSIWWWGAFDRSA